MTIANINVDETIQNARKLLAKENVSPAFRSIMDVLFLLLWILINRVSKNSKNSSIPPSQDPNRQKQNKWEWKPWAKAWHQWKNLQPFPENEVDEIIPISIQPKQLSHDNNQQRIHVWVSKRQEVDIIISRHIKEYQAEVWKNQYGIKVIAEFPEWITNLIQYGTTIKAHATYMNHYQLLSYDRISDYFGNILWLPVSVWSIRNWSKQAYDKREGFENILRE